MTNPAVPVVRLTREVYDNFAKQFRPIQPNEQTSVLQAGYALGVTAVLTKLREQIVVDEGA